MFVAINNTDMGLNDIEKWIKTARDANGGVISPEFAMEVLSKTNLISFASLSFCLYLPIKGRVVSSMEDLSKETLKANLEFTKDALSSRTSIILSMPLSTPRPT